MVRSVESRLLANTRWGQGQPRFLGWSGQAQRRSIANQCGAASDQPAHAGRGDLYVGSYTNESTRAARDSQMRTRPSSVGGPSLYQRWR